MDNYWLLHYPCLLYFHKSELHFNQSQHNCTGRNALSFQNRVLLRHDDDAESLYKLYYITYFSY